MKKVIFTNSLGENITLDGTVGSKPYFLISLVGTGAMETDIQTQKAPFQDGSTFIDALLGERSLIATGAIICNTKEELYQRRRELAKALNPKLGLGTLRYQVDGGDYEISPIADGGPIFSERTENKVEAFPMFQVNFVCPDPLWREPEMEESILEIWSGGLEFPLTFSLKFATSGNQAECLNDGDVETPVQIVINGPAVNPYVENQTTGKIIEIQQTILTGERIEINTAFGQKEVTHYDTSGVATNVMHWLSDDSELWSLALGNNTIVFNDDTGSATAGQVTVTYYNRYVGV